MSSMRFEVRGAEVNLTLLKGVMQWRSRASFLAVRDGIIALPGTFYHFSSGFER